MRRLRLQQVRWWLPVSNIILDAIAEFPDYLATQGLTNINKLVAVIFQELNNFDGTFAEIERNYDIDQATLNGLDQIGTNLDTPRDGLEDEEYRTRLKIQQARNLADGTFSSIITILQSQLGIDDPSLIIIEELGNANLRIEVPIENAGFERIEGTFVLGGEGEDEFDISTGLADDEEEFGGVLGGIEIDENTFNGYKTLVQAIRAAGVGAEAAVTGSFILGDAGEDEIDTETGLADGDETFGGLLGGVI